MKIAVQLFGHLRTYKRCYKALQRHLLSKYDCDVFMHTWSTIDHNTATWHNDKMRRPNQATSSCCEKIKKLYQLQDLITEEQKPKDLGKITVGKKEISIYGISCMIHSMASVNQLRKKYAKENKIKYDFVLMIRPDILLKKDFKIEDYIQRLSEEEVNQTFFTAGNPNPFLLSDFKTAVATDILFFAKPKLFDDIFNHTDDILINLIPNAKFNFGPEYFLIKTVNGRGYNPILINYTFGDCFEMLRPIHLSNLRKQLFRLRIKNHKIQIYLFQICSRNIVRFQADFLGFQMDFCIGNLKGKV